MGSDTRSSFGRTNSALQLRQATFLPKSSFGGSKAIPQLGHVQFIALEQRVDCRALRIHRRRALAPNHPSPEELLGSLAVHRLGEEREPAHQVVARFDHDVKVAC